MARYSLRINGVLKNFNIEAKTEWIALKIAYRFCKGMREKGKAVTFMKLLQTVEPKEEFAIED